MSALKISHLILVVDGPLSLVKELLCHVAQPREGVLKGLGSRKVKHDQGSVGVLVIDPGHSTIALVTLKTRKKRSFGRFESTFDVGRTWNVPELDVDDLTVDLDLFELKGRVYRDLVVPALFVLDQR